MKKMKIALAGLAAKPIPPLPGEICAPNDIVARLAEGLAARGHEVTVFTGEDSKINTRKVSLGLKNANIEYSDKMDDLPVLTRRQSEYGTILANEAIKRYHKGEFDIINFHDFRLSPYLFDVTNVPVIYTVHGRMEEHLTLYDKYRYKILSGKQFGFTNMSHENIEFCEKNKLTSFGYTPNGIDVSLYELQDKGRNGVLYAGRIIEHKKIREAIEATLEADENIKLYGPSGSSKEDKKYFEDLKKDYFNRSEVEYGGMIPREELTPHYKKASVLVYFTSGEGMPLALIEAAATGLPIVASDVGGVRDVVVEGTTGVLIPAGTTDKRVIGDAIKRAKGIDNKRCRDYIIENFSIDSMVNSYEKAYEKALG